MANNRRDFLKITGLWPWGLFGSGILAGCTSEEEVESKKAAIVLECYNK